MQIPFLERYIDDLFRLAVIQRWNDHPRPFNITELDKQGHKAIVAYLFAKIEETERGKSVNWNGLIEGLIFEALQRSVFTDLKPRLFHKLLKTKRGKLNEHLFKTYERYLKNFDDRLWEDFKKYFSDDSFLSFEKHIIRASHFIPTYWEFQFIYPLARAMPNADRVKEELENTLEDFHHLIGIQRFLLRRKLYSFINLCGQLRFQKRWISVERIPQTSVMGHLFFVATLVYLLMRFIAREAGIPISDRAYYSTFFAALFHDLPEIITRDIISNLKDILGREEIRKIEVEGLENEVLSLLPGYIADEIRVFLALVPPDRSLDIDEFADRVFKSGKLHLVEGGDLSFLGEDDGYPIWGTLIKFADLLSAYYEAHYTLKHGIRNDELENALQGLREKLITHPLAERFEFLKCLVRD